MAKGRKQGAGTRAQRREGAEESQRAASGDYLTLPWLELTAWETEQAATRILDDVLGQNAASATGEERLALDRFFLKPGRNVPSINPANYDALSADDRRVVDLMDRAVNRATTPVGLQGNMPFSPQDFQSLLSLEPGTVLEADNYPRVSLNPQTQLLNMPFEVTRGLGNVRVLIPEGAKGLYAEPHLTPKEASFRSHLFVLPRNTRFRVVAVDPFNTDSDGNMLTLEVVP